VLAEVQTLAEFPEDRISSIHKCPTCVLLGLFGVFWQELESSRCSLQMNLVLIEANDLISSMDIFLACWFLLSEYLRLVIGWLDIVVPEFMIFQTHTYDSRCLTLIVSNCGSHLSTVLFNSSESLFQGLFSLSFSDIGSKEGSCSRNHQWHNMTLMGTLFHLLLFTSRHRALEANINIVVHNAGNSRYLACTVLI